MGHDEGRGSSLGMNNFNVVKINLRIVGDENRRRKKKEEHTIHRFYMVRQCAYIHGNDGSIISLSPNRVT